MTSSADDLPPKDDAQELLRYLDILYPNGEPINTVVNIIEDGPFEYKPEVDFFFQCVGLHAHDYNYDFFATHEMINDPDKIAKANWTQIKQMLSCLGRAERLSYGNHARAIESGKVKRILLRLKELVEQ